MRVCACVCVRVCGRLRVRSYLEWFGLSGHTVQCVDGE